MLAREKWQVTTIAVLDDVFEHRLEQVAEYGHNEDTLDGTGPEARWLLPYTTDGAARIEADLRADYEEFVDDTGAPTWVHLLREELAESFAETDPELLYGELKQVAALAVSWMEKLRTRGANPLPPVQD